MRELITSPGDAHDATLQRLAVDARAAAAMFGLSLRTWRRFDAAGRVPVGFKIGGRKLWRVADLRQWAALGFPDRSEFVARQRAEADGGRCERGK